jgi:glycosidase
VVAARGFYEIYPRSFADSNNDGVGDLKGPGFEVVPNIGLPRLVDLARRERAGTAAEQLDVHFWRLGMEGPVTKQYYYHYFCAEQPDLNSCNPAVKGAMFDVTRRWYKRGGSGFRLDAVDTLFEDPNLHDNPVLPGKNAFGDPIEANQYNTKLREVHDVLRGLRKVADENNAVLIGETWTADIAELNRYYGRRQQRVAIAHGFSLHQGG